MLGLAPAATGQTGDAPAEIWGIESSSGFSSLIAATIAEPGAPHARIGNGLTHHVAFETTDGAEQRRWQERLRASGVEVTPVMERKYFRSIYFKDPDGHILEIATRGPGMLIDEEESRLGTALSLPEWLEPQRAAIESRLAPLAPDVPRRSG
jgi:hypothetical protein